MKLATVIDAEHGTRAAVDIDGAWHPLPYGDVGELLADPAWTDAAAAAASTEPLADVVFTTLVTAPAKVICCGHNYEEHIRELGNEIPEYPTLFPKYADTLTGPFDDILIDDRSDKVDWEAELAVVIGRTVSRADKAEAAAAIAGYTIANDISIRDWQRRNSQWMPGKVFEATTPLGPVLVTPDEIDPLSGVDISCEVNGETVQHGNTSTLVFDAVTIVAYISQFTTLHAGDVVLTGTPGGVGAAMTPPRYLVDGDILTTTIEGIGSTVNNIRNAAAKEGKN
jgi:acylpyruvate hydrolase